MRPVRQLCLCALIVACCWSSVASAQSVVGVGAKGFFEDSKLHGLQQIAVAEVDESYEYRSAGFLSASLWFLLELSDKLRVGSTLDYYGIYGSKTKCDRDDCSDFEPDRYEFGRLIEFYGRFEYRIRAAEKAHVLLGGVVGFPVLFATGDFREDINSLRDQGASVLGVPRVGYLLGPNLGVRYQYTDYLAFRADFIGKWQQMFLFRTSQNIGSDPPIAFRKRWTTGTLRYEFGLGLEVSL